MYGPSVIVYDSRFYPLPYVNDDSSLSSMFVDNLDIK